MFVSLLILAFNALSASAACATTSSSVGACDGTSLTTTYFTSGVCDSKTLVSEFCGATTDEFATTDEVDETTAYTTLCTDGLVTTIYTYVYYVSDSTTSRNFKE